MFAYQSKWDTLLINFKELCFWHFLNHHIFTDSFRWFHWGSKLIIWVLKFNTSHFLLLLTFIWTKVKLQLFIVWELKFNFTFKKLFVALFSLFLSSNYFLILEFFWMIQATLFWLQVRKFIVTLLLDGVISLFFIFKVFLMPDDRLFFQFIYWVFLLVIVSSLEFRLKNIMSYQFDFENFLIEG